MKIKYHNFRDLYRCSSVGFWTDYANILLPWLSFYVRKALGFPSPYVKCTRNRFVK